MAYRGAEEVVLTRFAGGLCLLDATEIGDDQASDCQNVDMEQETIRRRLGHTGYGVGVVGVYAATGAVAYYPRGSDDPILCWYGGDKAYADVNRDGDFLDVNEEIATGLSHSGSGAITDAMDFVQWRDTLYFGNQRNALRSWKGAGVSAAVAALTAPASAPPLSPLVTLAENFETAAGWTAHTGGTLAQADEATQKRQGTNSLKVTADNVADRGDSIYKAWSAGATVDLSEVTELVLWVMCDQPRVQFIVAIYEDGVTPAAGTQPNWNDFPSFVVPEANTWFRIRVPLGAIEPTSRDASPGLGIRFLSDGGRGFTPAINLYFDDCTLQGGMEPDEYRYYYTKVEKDSNGFVIRESGPSPVATIHLQADAPFRGVNVGVTSFVAAAGTTGFLRVYRYRLNGPFRKAVMVKEAANSSTTLTDTRDDRAVAEDATAQEMSYSVSDPPLCAAWAIVNNRLVGGYAKVSSTEYPWRIYLSEFGYPEKFSASERPGVDAPTAAGWVDLPEKDTIRRIVELDGRGVILCDRSIWTLEGSGWDDFRLIKRANIGLTARWAVATLASTLFFLSGQGVYAMWPVEQEDGTYVTQLLSEPVDRRLRPMGAPTRPAMGIDERGRLHVAFPATSVEIRNTVALVLDLRAAGALARGDNPKRPGWTYYTNQDFGIYFQRRQASGGAAQLMAAENTSVGYLYYLHQDASGADILTDAGSAIAWNWTSKAYDAGPGRLMEWVFVSQETDVQAGQTITHTPVLNRTASATTYALSTAATSGQAESNVAAGIRGRLNALKISGSHSVDIVVRSLRWGYWMRG